MSAHAYSEDQIVEQPVIGLFAVLGWQTVSALEETFGTGGTLGRETKSEVALVERLRTALCKFNPALPPEAISNTVDELTSDRSAMSLAFTGAPLIAGEKHTKEVSGMCVRT